MNAAEAASIVELVHVTWPRAQLSDLTKQAWAELLIKTEPHANAADGYEAVRDLAAHQSWPPAIAEVILGVHGARLNRQATRGQLPEPKWHGSRSSTVSFASFIREHPEGVVPTEQQQPAYGERQAYCDHEGEPEHMSFAEYLRIHPDEAERIKRLKGRKDDAIPAALEALLRGSNV